MYFVIFQTCEKVFLAGNFEIRIVDFLPGIPGRTPMAIMTMMATCEMATQITMTISRFSVRFTSLYLISHSSEINTRAVIISTSLVQNLTYLLLQMIRKVDKAQTFLVKF